MERQDGRQGQGRGNVQVGDIFVEDAVRIFFFQQLINWVFNTFVSIYSPQSGTPFVSISSLRWRSGVCGRKSEAVALGSHADAVAAVLLGPVEGSVSGLDECFHRGGVFAQFRNAEG